MSFIQLVTVFFAIFASMSPLRAASVDEFYGFPPPPQSPYAGLFLASDGNFYGTTIAGGTADVGGPGGLGVGTIFRLTPDGKMTMLAVLSYESGGEVPRAPVVQGPDGQLYAMGSG